MLGGEPGRLPPAVTGGGLTGRRGGPRLHHEMERKLAAPSVAQDLTTIAEGNADPEPTLEPEAVLSRLRHDLNNPLTAISGLAELLLMKEEALSEVGRKRLQMIIDNCARMSQRLKQATLQVSGSASSGASPSDPGRRATE